MKTLLRATLALLLCGLLFAALLVAVGRHQYRSDIYAWLPDGTVKRVSPDDGGTYYQACVSPDGSNVIFAGAATGPPRVWRADLPSGELQPLTPPDSAAFLATYRWDGQEIVFSSDRAFDLPSIGVEELLDPRLYRPGTKGPRHRDFNLFAMDPEGGQVRQLTRGPVRDLRATYTPDGGQLTFFSTREPPGPFYTMPADGSAEPARFELAGEELIDAFRPWYTADGETLYFFGMYPIEPRPFRYQLLRVPAAGGTPEPLAFDDRGKSQGPYLDPNGGFLLFHNNRSGRCELYEYPLDGEQPRMLHPPGLELSPGVQIMHPTRARDGTLTFDFSCYAGPAPLIWLRSLRAKIVAGVAWRWRELRD